MWGTRTTTWLARRSRIQATNMLTTIYSHRLGNWSTSQVFCPNMLFICRGALLLFRLNILSWVKTKFLVLKITKLGAKRANSQPSVRDSVMTRKQGLSLFFANLQFPSRLLSCESGCCDDIMHQSSL